jgi:hypothetical protein
MSTRFGPKPDGHGRDISTDSNITSAAVATDVGIHLAQDLVNWSSELFQKHGGILEIVKTCFKQAAVEHVSRKKKPQHSVTTAIKI